MKNLIAFGLLLFCFIATQGVFQDQCFIPGECVDSYSIEIISLADEFECLAQCKDQEWCEWFTFFPNPPLCQLFRNCTAIDEEACNDCFSGQRGCEVPEPQCWVPGECEGNSIISIEAESGIECLGLCKNEDKCKWFTFHKAGKRCFLFSECETFDVTTEGCISGERRCQEDVTTTTPTSSTSSPITTPSPVPVYSKVLIALGYYPDVEIIDLLSSETTCQKPENFPYPNRGAFGGLGFQDKPLICGGINNRSACHLYEDRAWKSSDSLKEGRFNFAMTKSPIQDGSKLFLTGGFGDSSSEVLTENGWQVSVPLPVEISSHCMVTVNSTSVMIVGGFQIGYSSGRTFLFNSETNIWTEGPTMNTARFSHSCGLIRKNTQTDDNSLIAVGGSDDSFSSLSSVEVLDLESNAWRRGHDLPFGIHVAAMVEDPSGGVVLIGGRTDEIEALDTLYRLPHAGSDATWELMPQKLRTGRRGHTVFLIPDDIADCN